jgi:hypothetical protein
MSCGLKVWVANARPELVGEMDTSKVMREPFTGKSAVEGWEAG